MKQLFLISFFVCFVMGTARADMAVPPLVNYQGTLTDANGAAIPDGMKKLEFNLYDAPLAGNRVWGPQIFDGVAVVSGHFNVILGTTDSGGRLLSAAFGASQRYLSLKVGLVGQDLTGIAEIAPRQQILSAPYSFRAEQSVLSDNSANSSLLDGKTTQQIIQPLQQTVSDLTTRLSITLSDSYWTAEIGGDGYHEALCNDGFIATGLGHRCGGECQYGGNHRFKVRCSKLTLQK
jgi:hypothetical protein